MRNSVVFYLNGQRHEVMGPAVFQTVAEYLRYSRGLTGTKVVCAEGDCGACSILRSKAYLGSKNSQFEAVNSCIVMIGQLDGCHIVTVEGLAQNQELSCAQKAMMNCHGSQCGYCTPGFVVTLEWMLERHPAGDEKTVKNHLTGNLCRCTGYQPIIDAGLEAFHLQQQKSRVSLKDRYLTASSLKELRKLSQTSIWIESGHQTFFAPASLKDLKKYRKQYPESVILGAGTDLGVQINKGKRSWTDVVSLQLLPEMQNLEFKKNILRVGAQVTLSQLRKSFKKYKSLESILDLFASPQIKNMATLVGNIANASPIADTPPFLLALNAHIEVLSTNSTKLKVIPLSEFYLGYRKTKLQKGDVIVGVQLELPQAQDGLQFYKSSQRKDLDISCVNAALWVRKNKKGIWENVRLAYGGIAATPVRLKKIEALLEGQSSETLNWDMISENLQKEIKPLSDLRGTAGYRRMLAQNILRKMIHDTNSP